MHRGGFDTRCTGEGSTLDAQGRVRHSMHRGGFDTRCTGEGSHYSCDARRGSTFRRTGVVGLQEANGENTKVGLTNQRHQRPNSLKQQKEIPKCQFHYRISAIQQVIVESLLYPLLSTKN